MDENVIAAMARWPDVPDVFGWLSLNARGHWRLHTHGEALDANGPGRPSSPGVPISSPRINQFINRNYARDAKGQWYFQNGPQRVYVRLDAAPFIFHTDQAELDHPVFLSHNGLHTRTVKRWCLDDAGHLYADTELGAGRIAGRDLEQVLDGLATADGERLVDVFERLLADPGSSRDVRWRGGSIVPCHVCHVDQAPDLLGFVRNPRPGP